MRTALPHRLCASLATLAVGARSKMWLSSGSMMPTMTSESCLPHRQSLSVVAGEASTDRLCYPARTGGRYSCRSHNRVVINLMRWETGTEEYQSDLTTYRTYLINHEVGHFLGRGHVTCPGAGEPAPVMMQQTKGLGGCSPNGWPTKDES